MFKQLIFFLRLFPIVIVFAGIGFFTSSYTCCYCGKHLQSTGITAAKEAAEKNPIATANALLSTQNKGLIVIDPGHGGKDYGTYSKKPPKYQEKYLNLTTAYMLKNFLQKLGYAVMMTRSKDVFIPLDKRAEFANDQNPRLFVSIHYNSAPSKDAEGIEIYYYRSSNDAARTSASKKLAQAILKRAIKNTKAKSRGVKHGDLAVVRLTNMPAVLVEGGFLTNANESLKLKDVLYLKKLAWGIAQGINEFIEQNPVLKLE